MGMIVVVSPSSGIIVTDAEASVIPASDLTASSSTTSWVEGRVVSPTDKEGDDGGNGEVSWVTAITASSTSSTTFTLLSPD